MGNAYRIRSKKDLEVKLSKLKFIEKPNIDLEQYMTNSKLASDVLWTANLLGDIKNKVVIDIGAGSGIFGIGALILGCKKTVFIEVDKRFKEIIENNLKLLGLYEEEYDVVMEDLFKINKYKSIRGDTGFINPPFGIQSKLDPKKFIEASIKIVDVLYAIIPRKMLSYMKIPYKKLFDSELVLKKTYWFHEKRHYKVPVSIIRIQKH